MNLKSTDYGAFRFIAHRGSPMRAPENTLISFQIARELGAVEIETDVQLTRDHVVVLCHDNTLVRYGHGERTIGSSSYHGPEGLSSLDFGAWFSPSFSGERIATLSSLLSQHRDDFVFHIELKDDNPQLAQEVIRLIQMQGLMERCVLTSFSYQQLCCARTLSHEIRLGWLVNTLDENAWRAAGELMLFQLCPRASGVTPSLVARSLEVVDEVRAWGCPQDRLAAQQIARQVGVAGCIGMTVDELAWF